MVIVTPFQDTAICEVESFEIRIVFYFMLAKNISLQSGRSVNHCQ